MLGRNRLQGCLDIARVLSGREWNDRDSPRRYQDRRLRALVEHAFENVPFYRRRFAEAGVLPGDVRGIDDLHLLPACARQEIGAAAGADVVDRGVDPGSLSSHTTSGSTGEPLIVRNSVAESILLRVASLRTFARAGAGAMDRRALIVTNGGTPLEPSLWARRGLFPWKMIDTRVPPPELARILSQMRPEIVVGFPGLLAEVAEEMSGIRGDYRPRFVVIAGETITDTLRGNIEAGFGSRTHSFYGSHEHPLLATECPGDPQRYHVAEDLVLLEVVRDGRPALPGEEGEVLITSLYSFAMPLIRYRIGDWAVQGDTTCACGAPVQNLGSIMGRVVERFTLPDGRRLHPLALVVPTTGRFRWIRRYQFVQETLHHVRVKLLASQAPTAQEVSAVQRSLKEITGDEVEYTVEIVARIDSHPTGKMRPYFSMMPADPRDDEIGTTGRRSAADRVPNLVA